MNSSVKKSAKVHQIDIDKNVLLLTTNFYNVCASGKYYTYMTDYHYDGFNIYMFFKMNKEEEQRKKYNIFTILICLYAYANIPCILVILA